MENLIVSGGLKEVYSQQDYILYKDIIEPTSGIFWNKKIEYNQDKVHGNSCFIHGFVGAITDLTGYKYPITEIKELVDEAWITTWADPSWGGEFQPACKFVAEKFKAKGIKDITYYRVPYGEYKRILELGYSIVTGFNVSREIMKDKEDDGIINHSGGNYGTVYNGHCIRLSMLDGKVYIIDNYLGKSGYNNIYEIKDIEAECKQGNFFTCGYFFVIKEKVKDGYEGYSVDQKIAKLRARKN